MHHWTMRLFALAAPLLLTGCLWGPGKFTSDLTLRKDGSFVLDYRGEIVLQLPPDAQAAMERHGHDAERKVPEPTARIVPCTKAEIAEQKAAYEKKRKDSEDMAKLSAFPGLTTRPTAPSPPS